MLSNRRFTSLPGTTSHITTSATITVTSRHDLPDVSFPSNTRFPFPITGTPFPGSSGVADIFAHICGRYHARAHGMHSNKHTRTVRSAYPAPANIQTCKLRTSRYNFVGFRGPLFPILLASGRYPFARAALRHDPIPGNNCASYDGLHPLLWTGRRSSLSVSTMESLRNHPG
jgi:hypothetical protein